MEKNSSIPGIFESLNFPMGAIGEGFFLCLLLGIAAGILSQKGAED